MQLYEQNINEFRSKKTVIADPLEDFLRNTLDDEDEDEDMSAGTDKMMKDYSALMAKRGQPPADNPRGSAPQNGHHHSEQAPTALQISDDTVEERSDNVAQDDIMESALWDKLQPND
jgi:hypothetical protein